MPAQRDEHATEMKKEMVTVIYPMTAQRDQIVKSMTSTTSFIMSVDKADPNYYFTFQQLEDNIEELLEIHTKICA